VHGVVTHVSASNCLISSSNRLTDPNSVYVVNADLLLSSPMNVPTLSPVLSPSNSVNSVSSNTSPINEHYTSSLPPVHHVESSVSAPAPAPPSIPTQSIGEIVENQQQGKANGLTTKMSF
jgi:hypothetical protein